MLGLSVHFYAKYAQFCSAFVQFENEIDAVKDLDKLDF